MARRHYSDDERAAALAALAANGGNLRRTARDLGVARTTLERWAKGTAHPEAAASAAPKKVALADLYEEIAYKSLGLLPGRLDGCNAVQLATVAGVATDKMQLLRGKATSINTHDLGGLTDADLDSAIAAEQRAAASAAKREASPPDGR